MTGRDVEFENSIIAAHGAATFNLVSIGHTLALAVAENPNLLNNFRVEDALETVRKALLEEERLSPFESRFVRDYRQKIETILYTGERVL